MPQERPLPERKYSNRFWIAISATSAICILLIWLDTHVFNHYTGCLFMLTPFFSGFCAVLLYGEKNITRSRAFGISLLTLFFIFSGLLLLQIDGLICLVMAAPLVIPINFIGAIIGRAIIDRNTNTKAAVILLFIAGIPSLGFLEENRPPAVHSVVTSIEIAAAPEEVWRHVIAFPKLDEPEEFIFKTGIAYPVDATIEGEGVGALRHCNFTTGSFVEPITVWDEPRLLKFSVTEQPAPLKELSYTDIDAPHLHDFFVSKEGQFRLKALPNGNTLLEGTTWYYHRIRPEFYWRLWSGYIIHQIHGRVLKHIKENAEKGNDLTASDTRKELPKPQTPSDFEKYAELKNSAGPEEQGISLEKSLRSLSPVEIIGFDLRTSKLLYDAYNQELWCAAYLLNGGCSDDCFDYFRCWPISRGRKIYKAALVRPDTLVSQINGENAGYEFEAFMDVARNAFKAKTGKEIHDYIDYEKFNPGDGKDYDIKFTWNENDPKTMAAICPKIFAKLYR